MQGVEMTRGCAAIGRGNRRNRGTAPCLGNGKQGESAPPPAPEQTALAEVLDYSLLTIYALMFGKNKKTPAEADEK